jgi:hypothetical protein
MKLPISQKHSVKSDVGTKQNLTSNNSAGSVLAFLQNSSLLEWECLFSGHDFLSDTYQLLTVQ